MDILFLNVDPFSPTVISQPLHGERVTGDRAARSSVLYLKPDIFVQEVRHEIGSSIVHRRCSSIGRVLHLQQQ